MRRVNTGMTISKLNDAIALRNRKARWTNLVFKGLGMLLMLYFLPQLASAQSIGGNIDDIIPTTSCGQTNPNTDCPAGKDYNVNLSFATNYFFTYTAGAAHCTDVEPHITVTKNGSVVSDVVGPALYANQSFSVPFNLASGATNIHLTVRSMTGGCDGFPYLTSYSGTVAGRIGSTPSPDASTSISGTVKFADGTPLSNVKLTLLNIADGAPQGVTVFTDVNGFYFMDGIHTGSGIVAPVRTGFAFTPTTTTTDGQTVVGRTVTVASTPLTNQDFVASYNVSGQIITDTGVPLPDVSVFLQSGQAGSQGITVTTNADGFYLFEGLTIGNANVIPTRQGFTFDPAAKAVSVTDQAVSGINFTANHNHYPITGKVYSPDGTNGLAGAKVQLGGISYTTLADGNYVLNGVGDGQGTINVTSPNPDISISPASRTVTVQFAGLSNINFIGVTQCTDGIDDDGDGKIDFKADGSGDPGCVDANDTSERGTAHCDDLLDNDGDGKIDYRTDGSGDSGCTSLTDPTEGSENLYTVSGRVFYADGVTGLPGATVSFQGVSKPVDPNGNYSFTNIPSGSGTVAVTHLDAALTFNPSSKTVIISNQSVTGVNFTAITQCTNGIDDDQDGKSDYKIDGSGDPGCTNPNDTSEHGAAQCDDGLDNDGDGKTDYRSNGTGDPGCSSLTDNDEHDSTRACDDGIDNDGDGKIDFKPDGSGDPGCTSLTDPTEHEPTLACDDGIDNDGDGKIDFKPDGSGDLGCTSPTDPTEHEPALLCDDGIDNDGDGKIDFKADGSGDPGCSSLTDNDEHDPTRACDDGFDNDADGKIDFKPDGSGDPGCTSPTDPTEHEPTLACDDGIDNDGDGKIDFKTDGSGDPGCSSPSDPTEKGTIACDDGIDNDNDGKVDYRTDGTGDPGCTGPTDVTEKGTIQCDDGLDNDADGKIDYNVTPGAGDSGCTGPTDPTESTENLYTVSGRVFNADGISGLSGAKVSFQGVTITVDASGNYSFANIPNGTGTVAVTAPNADLKFNPSSKSVTVADSAVTGVNFTAISNCTDGLDNDHDGKADYKTDGSGDPGCVSPNDTSEFGTAQCDDGADNDGDGKIDFRTDGSGDPGCKSLIDTDEHDPSFQCDDGVDNDHDGFTDYRVDGSGDPGCSSAADPNESDPNLPCDDGRDNDGDSKFDYTIDGSGDPGCLSPTDTSEYGTAQCDDGIDNDGDGRIDYRLDGSGDAGCSSLTDTDEHDSTLACDDGVDNDHDGLTDYRVNGSGDPGCSSPTDPSEHDPKAACDDAIDNDGDGKFDYKNDGTGDPGCVSPVDPSEYGTAQCDDGVDNDSDGKTDTADSDCTSLEDPTEGGDPAGFGAPKNLKASDGTSTDFVEVTWDAVTDASSYQVYRSQFSGDEGDALFTPLTGTRLEDTSAVPNVTYYYTVRALKGVAQSAPSNMDSGFRAANNGMKDCDGDGVSDDIEVQDGTGVCDPGSFRLHLRSPAYTKYNTFLSQQNFLELVASGTKGFDLTVSVLKRDGSVAAKVPLHLDAGSEFDVALNALVPKDSYGLVKVEFPDTTPGVQLQGRMSNYRLDPNGVTYSFAFARELRNPTRGNTYTTGNSYDPQAQGYLVPNWAEIINLSDRNESFEYNLYSQDGKLLMTKSVSLPAFGEFDVQAGHEFGEGVYLAEVKPRNGAVEYFSSVARYSSNSKGGNEADTYNFAFSLEGRAGNGDSQFAEISNRVSAKWFQTNWVEVINVREKPVTASIKFRDENGSTVGSTSMVIGPKAQFHFNGSGLLAKDGFGSVEISSSDPGSLVSQSLVYYHDSSANLVRASYASPARITGRDVQTGTVNTFLGMTNMLILVNTSTDHVKATVKAQPAGGLNPVTVQLALEAASTLHPFVNGALGIAQAALAPDTYAVLTVQSEQPMSLLPEILRLREVDGQIDFVFSTAVQ